MKNNIIKLILILTLAAVLVACAPAVPANVDGYTELYVEVNGNLPYFEVEDYDYDFEYYEPLDELGRCGSGFVHVDDHVMPTEDRQSISAVHPTGWHSVSYESVPGDYLYNRSHLVGFQIAGENANELNLITGTRSMNVEGMLPFENLVADYVRDTQGSVLYRVTPIFEGENLVASGVLMEAMSVQDDGEDICFNVFVFNTQPDIEIDYATGQSEYVGEDWQGIDLPEIKPPEVNPEEANESDKVAEPEESSDEENALPTDFVLNVNSKKIHLPVCSSVSSMSEENAQPFSGTLQEALDMGYEACKICLD